MFLQLFNGKQNIVMCDKKWETAILLKLCDREIEKKVIKLEFPQKSKLILNSEMLRTSELIWLQNWDEKSCDKKPVTECWLSTTVDNEVTFKFSFDFLFTSVKYFVYGIRKSSEIFTFAVGWSLFIAEVREVKKNKIEVLRR